MKKYWTIYYNLVYHMFSKWYHIFSIWYHMFSIWYHMFSIWSHMFFIWYHMFSIWYHLFSLWYHMFSIRYHMFSIWYHIFSIWYHMFSVIYDRLFISPSTTSNTVTISPLLSLSSATKEKAWGSWLSIFVRSCTYKHTVSLFWNIRNFARKLLSYVTVWVTHYHYISQLHATGCSMGTIKN